MRQSSHVNSGLTWFLGIVEFAMGKGDVRFLGWVGLLISLLTIELGKKTTTGMVPTLEKQLQVSVTINLTRQSF